MEAALGSPTTQKPSLLQKRRSKAPTLPPNSTTNKPKEYAANLILPLSSIINAVEIDPISRSKAHCMQIIAEEKSYRFCASSEDALAEWLGALKSQLARRKEVGGRKGGVV
jgi:hypothetical protein